VRWLLVSSLVARIPVGMEGFAVVLAVTRAGGSYTRAGAVLATVVCTSGVGAPVFGRIADRVGRRRLLLLLAVLHAGATVALAFAITGSTPLLFVLAAVTGLTEPPVVATMRAAWSGLVTGAARESAYALEATAQELQFIVGPMLVALLAATIAPRAAVASIGIVGLIGVAAMSRLPAVDAREETTAKPHRGSALGVGGLRRCMLTLGLMIFAFSCIEIGVVAAISHSRQASAVAGIGLAMWSVGSMAGGLWYGSRTEHRFPAWASVGLVAVSFLLLDISTNRAVLIPLLILSGTTVAPMFGRMYAEVSAVSPASVITEAYGWITVGNLTGSGIGAPVAGYLVGVSGPRLAFLVAAAAGAVATLTVMGLPSPPASDSPAPYEALAQTEARTAP
jgi:MFS family permease